MAQQISEKKNLIIIVVILVVGFIFLAMSNNDESIQDDIVTDDVKSEEYTESENIIDETDSIKDQSATDTALEADTTVFDKPLGTGGPIIGYDEEKFPIYGNDNDEEIVITTTSLPIDVGDSEPNSVASVGAILITSLDTISNETYELIRPDLLELIAALESLIVDLQTYISYRKSIVL